MTYADVILAALHRSGRSGREVSLAAVGHESAIRSIKRGMDVRASTLQRLCEELGLDFYVGPPRSGAGSGGYDAEIRERETPPGWVADLRADLSDEIRRLAGAESGRISDTEFRAPGDHLAADLAWSTRPRTIPGVRFVDCYEVPPAPARSVRLDDSTRAGCLAFRQTWLDRYKLDAAQCAVVHVYGESVAPTLVDGSTVMINRAQRRRRVGAMFLVSTAAGMVVARAGRDADGVWQLIDGSRSEQPLPWPDDAELLGQVRWGTCTWR
jgi:hypothetical protein